MLADTDLRPLECFKADVVDTAFSPHRHSVYTLALTRRGIQAFDYRGETRHARPGDAVILHPDEIHDGRPVDETGFGYRALTLPPEQVAALRPGALPHVAGGTNRDPRMRAAISACLDADARGCTDRKLWHHRLADLVIALDAISDAPSGNAAPDRDAVERSRRYIARCTAAAPGMAELEHISGIDRWRLSRDFRRVLGTSPYRYWQMQRLERARTMILGGNGLADTAYACGFADQAHMTRQFRQTFGLSPRRWHALLASAPACTIVQ